MQKNQITSFMELILFDQSLLEYENQLDTLYEQISSIEGAYRSHSQDFLTKQHQLSELRKFIKNCEKELDDAIAQEALINQTHKDIHAKKEYTALKKELDHYHAVQNSLEKKLLTSLSQAEVIEKECKELEQQKDHASNTIQASIEECKAKITALEESFEQAKLKRDEYQKQVPPEWIIQYERMRNEVADPLAFIFEDSCSACFQVLTPYDMIRVSKGPVTCKGCFRFLCMRPE